MLSITEIKKGYIVPLLEKLFENDEISLREHLAITVEDGLVKLFVMANLETSQLNNYTTGFCRYDLHAIAEDPDVAAWLCCYERDNARLASSFHASELKPRSCLRRLSYPLVGFKSKKEFSAYATLTALVGDWVHQALQELMERVEYLLAYYKVADENGAITETLGIELDLKRAKLSRPEKEKDIATLNIGCRVDMQLLIDPSKSGEITGDIKTNNSSKWLDARKHSFELQKYGYQVVLGGYFTSAHTGLILEVCRDTFVMREHQVEFDDAANDFRRSMLVKVKEANIKVKLFNETFTPGSDEWKAAIADPDLLPEPEPGKGYESCWGCPWNYKMVCPASDWEKNQ